MTDAMELVELVDQRIGQDAALNAGRQLGAALGEALALQLQQGKSLAS